MISFEPETFFFSESSAVAFLKEDDRERHLITLVHSSDVSVGIWVKLPPFSKLHQTVQHVTYVPMLLYFLKQL